MLEKLERDHLTKEEWQDLEPYLVEAEAHARAEYLATEQAKALLGERQETPGYLLLQRLKERGDEEGVRLFRAAEMYQHELVRHDLAVAYLRGKQVGGSSKEDP